MVVQYRWLVGVIKALSGKLNALFPHQFMYANVAIYNYCMHYYS